ncbi:MAG: 3'-5' exonuclease [Gemmatimonadaceae bacterium]
MSGVSFGRPDSTLIARARAFLAAGPASAVAVIGHVCNLPSPPEKVALHLAEVLLGHERDFMRESGGRWSLVREVPLCEERYQAAVRPKGLHDLRFVVVDVETTGTRATWADRITEIAAVAVEGGEVREVFETLVNPGRPIPPWVTQLTRITGEMVRHAPHFADVAPQLGTFMDGRVFVAHNAAFDWRFVSAEVARATGQRLEGDRLCTVRLASSLLPQLRRRTLDSVAHYFGVEIAARHRAGGDAVATAHVLLGLLRLARDRGVETLEDLSVLGKRAPVKRRKRRATPHWMTRDDSA